VVALYARVTKRQPRLERGEPGATVPKAGGTAEGL
jgi:hypothetical protein